MIWVCRYSSYPPSEEKAARSCLKDYARHTSRHVDTSQTLGKACVNSVRFVENTPHWRKTSPPSGRPSVVNAGNPVDNLATHPGSFIAGDRKERHLHHERTGPQHLGRLETLSMKSREEAHRIPCHDNSHRTAPSPNEPVLTHHKRYNHNPRTAHRIHDLNRSLKPTRPPGSDPWSSVDKPGL